MSDKRRRRFRIAVLVLVLLLAPCAGEVACRLAVLEKVEPLDRDGWHEPHPLLGWQGKAGFVGEGTLLTEPPRRFAVRLNGRGWRMDREVATVARPGSARVVLIGDSYVFGYGCEVEESCPERLRALLPDAEVLNLGTCAYGVDQMRLVVEHEALPLRPDLIVVAVIADDFRRALRTVSNTGHQKPRFVLEGEGVRLARPAPDATGRRALPPPPEPGSWRREDEPADPGSSFLRWKLGQLFERVSVGLSGGGEEGRMRWRLGAALLRDAHRVAAAQGVPLVVALLPMHKHLPGGKEPDPVRPLLPGLEPAVPILDLYPDFERAPDPAALFIPGDLHPSPAGQALLAEGLARLLRERHLFLPQGSPAPPPGR